MKVRIHLDKTAVLLAGHDRHGLHVVDVPAASLTPRQRQTLARFTSRPSQTLPEADFYCDVAPDGLAYRSSNDPAQRLWYEVRDGVVDATPEAVAGLLERAGDILDADEARQRAAEEAEEAKRAAEIAAVLASDPADHVFRSKYAKFVDQVGEEYVRTPGWELAHFAGKGDPRTADFLARVEAEVARRDADTLEAEHAPKLEEARRAVAAKAELARSRAAEKVSWIAAHGSDRLRKSAARGHDCWGLYVRERAALEHPGFVVDFDDLARWKARSCPSAAALEAAEAVEGAEIVWLTRPPRAHDDYEDGEYAGREALVVGGFLGKYDLVRELEAGA